MNYKSVVAIGIGAVLVGLLIGYLTWGRQSQTLINELTQTQARLAEVQARVTEEMERSKAAAAQLQKTTEDLEFERERRAKLELLLSKGRK